MTCLLDPLQKLGLKVRYSNPQSVLVLTVDNLYLLHSTRRNRYSVHHEDAPRRRRPGNGWRNPVSSVVVAYDRELFLRPFPA